MRSRRNVFGAYALYDLIARLVLGDRSVYSTDRADAFDASSGINVTVELERQRGVPRGLIATPESGLRMTALSFRAAMVAEQLSATRIADRPAGAARTYGMQARSPTHSIVLLGSSPLDSAPDHDGRAPQLVGGGPVGVIAGGLGRGFAHRRRALRC